MNRSRVWGGVFFIALGLLFLLDSMDVMEFGDFVRTFWPLILVYFGIRHILGRSRAEAFHHVPDGGESESARVSSEMVHQSAVFGNVEVRVDSSSFAGGSASTVFGDVNIDLTAVTFKEGRSFLRLSSVFGTTRVHLPRGVEYAVSLKTVIGSLTADDRREGGFGPGLEFQTAGYAQATRTLFITASQVFGDVTVRSA
jgi:predicted membrane protein